jgi:hypothetical protein
MSQLKPDTKYIYERVDNVVYAREPGADPGTRVAVGWGHENKVDSRTSDGRPLHDHLMEDKLWGEIRRAARANDALQAELERVKMLYYLIKEENKPVDWHPV